MTTESEVRAAVDAFIAALTAPDLPAVRSLLTDRFLLTHATSAAVDDKESFTRVLDGRLRFQSIEVSDVITHVYSDAAVVIGAMDLHALVAEQDIHHVNRFTQTWVSEDGTWKLAAWQSTPIPEHAGTAS